MKKQFPEIQKLLQGVKEDEAESKKILHMTSNENIMSKTARAFLDSDLSFRYHLDRTGERTDEDPATFLGSFLYKGLSGVQSFEKAATEAAKQLFGATGVDLRPLSGVHAMMETLISVSKAGDVVYTVPREAGGHFTTADLLKFIGRKHKFLPFLESDFSIDIESLEEESKTEDPAVIYLDTSYHIFPYELEKIRTAVGEKPVMVYDASHTLGLIAGKQFQNPLREGCQVLQGNTHKTFPGPQKGMIVFGDKAIEERIEKGINVGLVSSQHTHHALCLYMTVFEMLEFGQEYARQTIKNAKALALALEESGFDVFGKERGFTKSHLIIVKDTGTEMNQMCKNLFRAGISTNTSTVFGCKGIRIGVQEATRRGMAEGEMEEIAGFYKRAVFGKENLEKVRRNVSEFNSRFKKIHYSFDNCLGIQKEVLGNS